MGTQRILIVEDDDLCRHVMERRLRTSGHEPRACSCGEQAMNWLGSEVFDILITDFRMPGMDGLELIEKALNIAPTLVTILMTGVPPEDLHDRLRKSGVTGFLSKPLDWRELSLLLERSPAREKQRNSSLRRLNSFASAGTPTPRLAAG